MNTVYISELPMPEIPYTPGQTHEAFAFSRANTPGTIESPGASAPSESQFDLTPEAAQNLLDNRGYILHLDQQYPIGSETTVIPNYAATIQEDRVQIPHLPKLT